MRVTIIAIFMIAVEVVIWRSVAGLRKENRVQLDNMIFQTGVLSPLMSDYINVLEEMHDVRGQAAPLLAGKRERLMAIRRRIEPHLTVLRQATDLLPAISGGAETSRRICESIDQTRAILDTAQAELVNPATATQIETFVDTLQDNLAFFAGSVVHTIEQDLQDQQERSNLFATVIGGLFSVLLVAGLILLRLVSVLRGKTDTLNRLAITDTMTGLMNRGECMRRAAQISLLARRKNVPVTVAIIDLDHFKAVNDTYGHPAGDAVLKSAALTIGANRRDSDVVARLGGEEFAVIMYDTSPSAAAALCERARQDLEAAVISFNGSAIRITASIGVATGCGEDADFETLYVMADEALYTAKETGRNRIVVANRHTVREARSTCPASAAASNAAVQAVSLAGL